MHSAFHLHKVGGGKVGRRAQGTDIILLGFGRVGRELVSQITALARDGRAPVRIVGLIDKAGWVFDARGLSQRRLGSLMLHKQTGGALGDVRGGEWGTAREAVDAMGAHSLMRPVLVDVASGDTGPALVAAISHGMDLVLANKVPLAGDVFSARAILQDARARGRRVLHEATVGAGLPVIDTLQQLMASGDRVHSVEGCPSGTMGYLFSEMARGRTFSDAVRNAMELGYTEPDPRDDLCGLDVARKGLILGRLLGYSGELTDVAIESLVPESLRDVSKEQFLAELPSIDEHWERLREGGARAGRGAALPGARHARRRPRRSRGRTDRQPAGLARRHRQPVRVHHGALSRASARRVGPGRRRRGHRRRRARRPASHGGRVTALAPGRTDARTRVVVSVPGGIGNLGPGLDVLGCAVAGLRDEVTAEWCDSARRDACSTRDIPSCRPIPRATRRRSPRRPCSTSRAGAARSCPRAGHRAHACARQLPLSGGQGGSAASAVAGAVAADALCGSRARSDVAAAVLPRSPKRPSPAGISTTSRRRCSAASCSCAPSIRSTSCACPIPDGLRIVLAHPSQRLRTSEARGVLPALAAALGGAASDGAGRRDRRRMLCERPRAARPRHRRSHRRARARAAAAGLPGREAKRR